MNSNVFYEGKATGAVVNGAGEIIISRVAEHSCLCDECRALDIADLPLLALCKRYLNGEIQYEELYLEVTKHTFERPPELTAVRQNFDSGAIELVSAIDGYFVTCSLETDENDMHTGRRVFGKTQETVFKQLLRGFVFGYEIRMRTVHQWRIKRDNGV